VVFHRPRKSTSGLAQMADSDRISKCQMPGMDVRWEAGPDVRHRRGRQTLGRGTHNRKVPRMVTNIFCFSTKPGRIRYRSVARFSEGWRGSWWASRPWFPRNAAARPHLPQVTAAEVMVDRLWLQTVGVLDRDLHPVLNQQLHQGFGSLEALRVSEEVLVSWWRPRNPEP